MLQLHEGIMKVCVEQVDFLKFFHVYPSNLLLFMHSSLHQEKVLVVSNLEYSQRTLNYLHFIFLTFFIQTYC